MKDPGFLGRGIQDSRPLAVFWRLILKPPRPRENMPRFALRAQTMRQTRVVMSDFNIFLREERTENRRSEGVVLCCACLMHQNIDLVSRAKVDKYCLGGRC